MHPDVVSIGTAYGGDQGSNAQDTINAIDQTAVTLRKLTRHVVLIGDDAAIAQEPTDCLLKPARAADLHHPGRSRDAICDQRRARAARFAVVRLRDGQDAGVLLLRGRVPDHVGNAIVYLDEGHITAGLCAGAGPALGAAFQIAIM